MAGDHYRRKSVARCRKPGEQLKAAQAGHAHIDDQASRFSDGMGGEKRFTARKRLDMITGP
jgi:hypothetical protein